MRWGCWRAAWPPPTGNEVIHKHRCRYGRFPAASNHTNAALRAAVRTAMTRRMGRDVGPARHWRVGSPRGVQARFPQIEAGHARCAETDPASPALPVGPARLPRRVVAWSGVYFRSRACHPTCLLHMSDFFTHDDGAYVKRPISTQPLFYM